jgi:STE24 endopeptidase
MTLFSVLFIIALVIAIATRAWLAMRHINHIQQNRTAVPKEFSGEIGLDAHQKAADYSSARTRLNLNHSVADALLLLILTFGGLIQGLDQFAASWLSNDLWRGVIFIGLLTLISALADLPFSYYRTFHIEAKFDFNRMTKAMFFGDLLKQAAVALAFGLPLVLAVLWLMGKMGASWWLYVWVTWVVFNILVMAIYPTFIAPLFNKFSPMQEGSLKQRIEQLLAKCGFQSKGLFVMDGSRRSSHGNAYFTGFGKTKRIVFFDTLLSRLNETEIEAVLAHELGHFKMRHVIRRMAWTFAVSLVMLAILGYVKNQAWFYESLGINYPATNAVALALFVLVVPVFTFLLQPVISSYARKHEFEADAYAAKHSSARELVKALVKLYKDNASTLTPDPLHSAFYDSHPPAKARIERLQVFVRA